MDLKNPQHWDVIQEIFSLAVDLPESEREAYIRAASKDDAEVYSTLSKLLEADRSADSFLDKPILARSSPDGMAVVGNALAAQALQQLASSSALPADEPLRLPPLEAGDILGQRFRILRLVGEGGMGHVFEAWDMELSRSIALKAIRPEIASHPDSLRRFRREVSLALRITHPNVCRTFDMERAIRTSDSGTQATETREILFLTMEFLPGETLATRLARSGALALDEAQLIATQIAGALTCAHEAGVLHRDIKPSNIMLVASANSSAALASGNSKSTRAAIRAVVTDFGLARQDTLFQTSDLSTVTRSGIPIGTFAYMAPEQLEGEETTPATDIYAFGLLLFEMVTGQRAFPSGNPLGSLKERLTGPPPSPKSLVPDLPEPWCRAIEGCLRLHPADRLQAPTDVLELLTGARSQLPEVAPRSTSAVQAPLRRRLLPAQWSFRRKILTVCAVFLALVSLFAGGLRLYQSKADAKVAPGALVYLTPVKNETGEKAFDNLTELIQASLAQSAQINLLDQSRVGDTLEHMTKAPDTMIDPPIAREIAMRTGAVRVVFATVTGSQGSYNLNIDLQQPDASSPSRYRDHWTRSFAWQSSGSTASATIPQELTSTVRKAANWLRAEAGESNEDIVHLDVPPEDVTTGNWDALVEFNRALSLQGKLKTEAAVLELQKAVQLDPKFALAYGRLGDLEVSTGAITDGLHSYEHALDLTELNRLDLRERDRIRGLAAADSGDFEAAASAFRDYTVNYEHSYLGWFYLGYPLIMLGRRDEGIADIRRSYQLNPLEVSPTAQLAMFDAATGNYKEANELSYHLNKIGYPGYADYTLGLMSFLKGNYGDAKHQFSLLQHEQGPPGSTRGTLMLAHLAAEEGEYLLSIQLLSEGIDTDRRKGDLIEEAVKLLDRASVESKLHKYSDMLEDIEASLAIDKSPPRINSTSLIMGRALQTAPRAIKAQIRKALNNLDLEYAGDELGMYSKVAKLRLHAQTLWANGHLQSALVIGRRANSIDAPVSDQSYWVFLLTEAAEHQPNAKSKRELLEEAYSAAAKTVHDPGLAWKDANRNLPGFLTDEMKIFLELASRLERRNEDVEKIQTILHALNKGAVKAAV